MGRTSEDSAFEHILEYLRQTRGFDFTAYKPSTLMRRLRKRMQSAQIDTFEAYLDYLQVRPEEFSALFNTIQINVTSFFRDADTWETLRTTVVPEIISRRRADTIRVWSAGCASGQEPFSIAMLLAESMGIEAFRERVKIYATDVDEEALSEARRAIYDAKQVADLQPQLLEKYFDHNSHGYAFSRDLRRSVIFGRHDLLQDAPISRVDILMCRNTLMYFNAEAQARIMARFYFSGNTSGVLVLGRAEMLFSHASLFEPLDLKRRIFRAMPKVDQRDRLLLLAHAGREDLLQQYPNHGRLRDLAFDASNEAQVVLDSAGVLVATNATARAQFSLTPGDIGRPLQDLELSYRPAELRSRLDVAYNERREITLKEVAWERDGNRRYFNVMIVPLYDSDHTLQGSRISFSDVTSIRMLQDELTRSKLELETAYEELQSTNEELQTTNEELQSTVEELETTNEELQSTNEELETMNEELQSTNEELQTMNDELRNRSTELNDTNAFMEAVFTSLQSAVVVLDREMRIKVWNAGASDLWGVRTDEIQETNFFNLDIGLPITELYQPIRDVLAGGRRNVQVAARDRKGRSFNCRLTISPLLGIDRSVTGAILVMDGAERIA